MWMQMPAVYTIYILHMMYHKVYLLYVSQKQLPENIARALYDN